jgi:hypothetical protein
MKKSLKEMTVERRRDVRYLPHGKTFAALGITFSKVGKVKDISLGGLSIEYIVGENSVQVPTQVDVFLTDHLFHLYKVPCKLIYDVEVHVPNVNNKYVKILTTKRCGVELSYLSEDDKAQLELFLGAYTNGLA